MKKFSFLLVSLFALGLMMTASGPLFAGQNCCAGKSQSACSTAPACGKATTMSSCAASTAQCTGAKAMTEARSCTPGSGECCGKPCVPCNPKDCPSGKSCQRQSSGKCQTFGAATSPTQSAKIAL